MNVYNGSTKYPSYNINVTNVLIDQIQSRPFRGGDKKNKRKKKKARKGEGGNQRTLLLRNQLNEISRYPNSPN
jgi:hypothetical protein